MQDDMDLASVRSTVPEYVHACGGKSWNVKFQS
jgi:hypothetical protein